MTIRWVLIALMFSAALNLESTPASLGGTVTDTSGAPVAGTKVAVRNTETGFSLTTNSGDDGGFLFPRMPVGSYELAADKPGFSTYVQKGIQLTVNQLASQTIVLQVGQVSDRITLEANADLVDTLSGTAGP